jgi:protein-tyrosine-phosphatase
MRSAFAVAYLHQCSPKHARQIVGAGTHAAPGRAAQDSALRVAPEFGVSLAAHLAQPLQAMALSEGDVIVCMDRANEATVMTRYPLLAERVFLIGDIAALSSRESPLSSRDVADPFARGDEETRVAFTMILEHANHWLTALAGVSHITEKTSAQ